MKQNKTFLDQRSKAGALEYVKEKLTNSVIPDFMYFKVSLFQKKRNQIIRHIINYFSKQRCKLAVRSSAFGEDKIGNTHAGEFETILNVDSSSFKEIDSAISQVINSYKKNGNLSNSDDEIIIQLMIDDILMSGVIFSRDLNTGAPYYVVNYDDVSGLSNTVTSGDNEYSNRTLYIYRKSLSSLRSPRFINLIKATKELEILINKNLDIEFSLDSNLDVNLFQYRSMPQTLNWDLSSDSKIDKSLKEIKLKFIEKNKIYPGVFGSTNVLGQMPDWNPVEMIGRVPRPLAYSLYEKLITDFAWLKARQEMGYFEPSFKPLMVSLAGQPFIDVRLSFNSFLPKDINHKTAKKLVDTWLIRLKNSPELHDKVEFDVAITTWTFDIDEKIEKLTENRLSIKEKQEYKNTLKNHFIELILDKPDSGMTDILKKIEFLKNKQLKVSKEKKTLEYLISDCIKYGTIPFAKLARHAFIAKSILLSLQAKGVFTKDEVSNFQSSISTVATELIREISEVSNGNKSQKDFMKKYGHLRPGTYDILSPRYDMVKDFFNSDNNFSKEGIKNKFTVTNEQTSKIDNLLRINSIYVIDANGLMNYIEKAITLREYSKFVFTRSVSDILEIVTEFGSKNDMDRDEMSYVPIHKINTAFKMDKQYTFLKNISVSYKEQHQINSKIRLPQILGESKSIFVIPFQVSQPNFITNKLISKEIIVIKSTDMKTDVKLTKKIVCIEGADPGFDWIFSRGISGLITKYGGANSHMAIRCAEFDLPAAIGCGEQRFEVLLKSKFVILDCGSGLIKPITKDY